MKRLYIIIFLCIFFLAKPASQLDSLDIIYKMPIGDSVKCWRLSDKILSIKDDFETQRIWGLKLIEFAEKTENKKILAHTYYVFGAIYYFASKYDKAIPYYYKSLALSEEINYLGGKFKVYNHLGIISSDQNNSKRAVYFFRKAYDIAVSLNYKRGQFISANNIAVDYANMNNMPLAIYFSNISESIATEAEYLYELPILMGNKTDYYIKLNNKENALASMNAMNKYIAMDSLNDHRVTGNYFSALYYKFTSNYRKAIELLTKNIDIISKNDFHELMKNYKTLTECYVALKQFDLALITHGKYYTYNDSLNNSEKIRAIAEQESKYANLKTEKELEIEKLKNTNNALVLKRNRITMMLTGIILFITILGLVFVYKLFREKRKANTELAIQNSKITAQRKEILDSINYSKRIQDGILPSSEELFEKIGHHFVFYQSKDIVSGDFYWAAKREKEKFIIACCDCTGHGVPGAFMSLLGYSLLTKSEEVDDKRSPADMLNYLNEELPKVFKNEGRGEQIKDGMDASICEIDRINLTLRYSGANNSIYHITADALHIIKSQKRAISAMPIADDFLFTDKEIKLSKGDLIVMFTDGLADQFGGPKGKKFKYKQLEDVLFTNSQRPLDIQRQMLSEVFISWKGELEQIDDVCIIAIRV